MYQYFFLRDPRVRGSVSAERENLLQCTAKRWKQDKRIVLWRTLAVRGRGVARSRPMGARQARCFIDRYFRRKASLQTLNEDSAIHLPRARPRQPCSPREYEPDFANENVETRDKDGVMQGVRVGVTQSAFLGGFFFRRRCFGTQFLTIPNKVFLLQTTLLYNSLHVPRLTINNFSFFHKVYLNKKLY